MTTDTGHCAALLILTGQANQDRGTRRPADTGQYASLNSGNFSPSWGQGSPENGQ